MDLYIDRHDLGRALARVQDIIERRTTQPILAHVLLRASDNKLILTATDTEIAFIGEIPANVTTPGEVTVDAANLFQISRSLPEPTIRLHGKSSSRLMITSGRASFKLPSSSASEYPALPAFDSVGSIKIAEGNLKRLVSQTYFAVASDDSRYGLNGVHVEIRENEDGNKIRFVGTDGHRLAVSESEFEGNVDLSNNQLIPKKALNVMRKLLDNSDEKLEIGFGEGAIRVVKPGQVFWFRLIDGRFPDYEKVLPTTDANHKIEVSTRDLSSSIKRVSILVYERTKAVEFSFSDGDLTVNAHSVDRGEISDSMPIKLSGEPIRAGFNTKYLADVLNAVDGEMLHLSLGSSLAPCLVKIAGSEEAFFIIMPMRLD